MRITPIVFALAAVLVHCASLEPIVSGTCGNGVLDANEDCDSFPSSTCIKAGLTNQCRLSCAADASGTTTPCPAGWGCGTDDICRQMTGNLENAKAPVSGSVVT